MLGLGLSLSLGSGGSGGGAPALADFAYYLGDSITDYGAGASTTTSNYNNIGEMEVAMARAGWPVRIVNWYDSTSRLPGVAGNDPKNNIGSNLGQAGGGVSDVSFQADIIRDFGVKPAFVSIQIGTNHSVNWSSTTKNQLVFVSRRIFQYFPALDVPLYLCTLPPSPGRQATVGTVAISADIRLVVTQLQGEGFPVEIVDLEAAFGVPGDSADFAADTVHLNARGGGRGAAAFQAMLASDFARPNAHAAKANGQLLSTALSRFEGSQVIDFANNVPSGSGPVTGNAAANLTVSRFGHTSWVLSLLANPDTGGQTQRCVFTTPGTGEGDNSLTLSAPFTGADGKWLQAYMRIRDDQIADTGDAFTTVNLKIAGAVTDTNYGQANVPMYPTGRSGDVTHLMTQPFLFAEDGGTITAVISANSNVTNKTITVDIEEWKVNTIPSPVIDTAMNDISAYTEEAQAYFTAARMRNPFFQEKIDDCIAALKAAGIYAKLDKLFFDANYSYDSRLYNVIDPSFKAASTVMDWDVKKGTKGDGVVGSITIGPLYVAGVSQYQQDSASIFAWCSEDGGGIGRHFDEVNNTMRARIVPGATGNDIYRLGNQTNISITASPKVGFRCVSRTGPTTCKVFYNGVQVGSTSTAATQTPSTESAQVHKSGFSTGWDTDGVSIFGSGGGLSDGEVATLHGIFDAYMTAIQAFDE